MEQLIYEINGIKYVLVELIIADSNKQAIEKTTKQFNCIYQGVKQINVGRFFSKTFLVLKYLIPENIILEFNKSIKFL